MILAVPRHGERLETGLVKVKAFYPAWYMHKSEGDLQTIFRGRIYGWTRHSESDRWQLFRLAEDDEWDLIYEEPGRTGDRPGFMARFHELIEDGLPELLMEILL